MTEPLSARVDAPTTAPIPDHPDVAEWRSMTLDDLDAVMPAVRAVDVVDHPTWFTPRSDIADTFDMTGFDPANDSLIGFDADGSVVAIAFATRAAAADTRVQVYATGMVVPSYRGRGIGRQVLAWNLARSRQQLAESDSTLPGWILAYQYEENPSGMRLSERAGMRLERWFTSMDRVLADPIENVAAPSDIRIVPFSPALAEAARAARNDAFRDHWGSQPSTAERWNTFMTSEFLRPDLSFVAVESVAADAPGATDALGDPVRIVAFSLASVNEEDWEAQGYSSAYIDLIGVVRDHRRRGLAPAVTNATLVAARAAGLDRALLDVDTESPTGANALYERLGFRPNEREVAYVEEH